ncbi:MAG: hypothetical protein KC800_17770 [Candidatus Eremiobacteraeota bacterium]|nr:hypothetical protein [Candidatus Eremiobacteraeota bacterium]
MIASTISQKLNSVFQKLGDQQPKRLEGEKSWAKYDAAREKDRFESLAGDSSALDGTYDVANTHHPFAPPYRSKVQISGNSEEGTISRQDALFLDLPVRTEGSPTFLTSSETTFTAEGATKLEVVEGPKGTTARRLFTDFDEPQKDYVEEYFIAN